MSEFRLNDEQVRRFICDGVLVLDSGISPAIHQQIFEKIQWNNTHEFNMGNNVLPRVPELQQVLDAPVINGALRSVLGDDYILHPHRFMHASEPLDAEEREIELAGDEHGPVMGKGSSGSSFWHQDSQSPLSRARYHVPRLAMILYFPQDTPVERGPTRVIPGTHLQASLLEGDFPFALVADNIKAGTCLLVAFDIAHAGLSNRTDLSRYMFKFVFMRTRNPTGPSWPGGKDRWQAPVERLGRYDHTEAWSYIWDWMRGASRGKTGKGRNDVDVDKLISQLNGDEPARLAAVYTLAELGAVDAVVASLLTHAGKQREVGTDRKKGGKYAQPGDPPERCWNEGAFAVQDEAYALGAMGEAAIGALVELLGHEDAWMKINAAFALGEIGAPAAVAMSTLADQLQHERYQVARAALDAMACIGKGINVALPAIRQLLTVDNPAWQESLGRDWTGENQARFNAMCALINSDVAVDEIEDLLIGTFDDPNGYVPALALELLTRDGSREALQSALSFLKTRRWDDTLAKDRRVY